jgi:hypothetical protein
VLYANLRGSRSRPPAPLEVLGRFLHALGVDGGRVQGELHSVVALYRSALAARSMLVILDNAADAAQVQPLLPASRGCAVLVTSRTQLADLDGPVPLSVDLLPEPEAMALLARFAGDDRVTADPAAASAIVRACGGLPLALRIIGARVRARPAWRLADMATRLADERRRLDELRVGELAVRSSFQLSYQRLAPREARTFRLLGLLEGSDITAAATAALTGRPLGEAEAGLELLADAQLLETPAPGRYRFHDLLRLFARELAAAQDEEAGRRGARRGGGRSANGAALIGSGATPLG